MAIVSTLAFTGVYAYRVADEARKLSDALAATELVLAARAASVDLDGLAAAAAHELGTPLATIALVSKEMMARAASPIRRCATMPALLRSRRSAAGEILATADLAFGGRATRISARLAADLR